MTTFSHSKMFSGRLQQELMSFRTMSQEQLFFRQVSRIFPISFFRLSLSRCGTATADGLGFAEALSHAADEICAGRK